MVRSNGTLLAFLLTSACLLSQGCSPHPAEKHKLSQEEIDRIVGPIAEPAMAKITALENSGLKGEELERQKKAIFQQAHTEGVAALQRAEEEAK